MKNSLKNIFTRFIVFSILLSALNCQKEQEIEIEKPVGKELYTSPDIEHAQQFFYHNNTQNNTLTSRTVTNSFTDWEASETKKYKQTQDVDVDILYTPLYISTQRTDVKAFLASTERNGMVDARKIYMLYKSNDLSNGLSAYIFVFKLQGSLEYLYNYENGQRIDLEQRNSSANRSDTVNCGSNPDEMNNAQFDEWLSQCYPSLGEVVITVDNTPQGGNGTGLDFSPWVPINLPPVQGVGNNPVGGAGGTGTAWYVPNTVSANSFSITLALGIAPNSDVGNWLDQLTESNQEVLEAIATYLNNNRDRGNTGNTNNTNTNDDTDNPFEWQLPISDEAINTVIALIEFLDGGAGGMFNGELTPDDLEALEECIENTNTATFDACFEELGEDGLNIECKKIIDFLSDSQNQAFKLKLQELSSNTNLNLNFEKGATLSENETNFTNYQGTPNQPQFIMTALPNNSYEAFVHTHPNIGNGTLSVFSSDDLVAIATFIRNNKITGNFTAYLTTKKGTQYALTIQDPVKFLDFFFYLVIKNQEDQLTPAENVKLFNSLFKSKPLMYKYFDIDNPSRKINAFDNDNNRVLRQFLNFMDEADAGFTLFDAAPTHSNEAPFTTFRKLKLRNGQPHRQTACN